MRLGDAGAVVVLVEPEELSLPQLVKALREQGLASLRLLVSTLERLDRARGGDCLLGDLRAAHHSLGRLVLRVVVLLFAEARSLLATRPGGSLVALYERLLAERAQEGAAFASMRGAFGLLISCLREQLEVLESDGGGLFERERAPFLGEGSPLVALVEDSVVLSLLRHLLFVGEYRLPYASLDEALLGSVYEGILSFEYAGDTRRRLGAHYTSRALTEVMVERTLAPLLSARRTPDAILDLRICDPAMGSGAFLLEVCQKVSKHLVMCCEESGSSLGAGLPLSRAADLCVASSCVYGVDKNPLARDLARTSLWLWARAPGHPSSFVASHLCCGDSLLGVSKTFLRSSFPALDGLDRDACRALANRVLAVRLEAKDQKTEKKQLSLLATGLKIKKLDEVSRAIDARYHPFHWEIEFDEVFASGGFHAFVGNPPWVSYAGRAAQPLADELRRYYAKTSAAFAGYRNLQGLFVAQSAAMLRPSGRLGFVLPTSMSDLAGYEPCRIAHDELMEADAELPDFGDAFDDVFQPSMGLLSTRRAAPLSHVHASSWPLARNDLSDAEKRLLHKLDALPLIGAHHFGERGFQTMGGDIRKLIPRENADMRSTLPIYVGGDVEPFLRKDARLCCDPAAFNGRFRKAEEWRAVRVWVRQTARYPMAAVSDGSAFRNSILAGFSDDSISEWLLVAWLNASAIRWLHYVRYRDARQGMPQVKIGHLRSIPKPPPGEQTMAIEALGKNLAQRNAGITRSEQATLDALVSQALGLSSEEEALVLAWAEQVVFRRGSEAPIDAHSDCRA